MKRSTQILVISILLSACGGGGGSGSSTSQTSSTLITLPPVPDTPVSLYLNSLRSQAGLPSYTLNAQLEASATAHSNYQLANNIMGHVEVFGNPGYTGPVAPDRAKAAGYSSGSVSEDISYNKSTGQELIDDLMTAVYHRMGLLDFDKDEIGFGLVIHSQTNTGALWSVLTTNAGYKAFNALCAAGGETSAAGTSFYLCNDNVSKVSVATYDAGLATMRALASDLVVWPPAGSNIPPAFFEESPDPMPECSISGNPVSVQVNPARNAQIQLQPATFVLKEKLTGTVVPLFRTLDNTLPQPDPAAASWQSPNKIWFAAFPTQRLNWGTTYQASINYVLAGVTLTKAWEFTTHSLPATPNIITLTANQTVNAPGQTQFVVYVPPGDCTASRMQVSWSATGLAGGQMPNATIQNIDPHTFLITTSGVSQIVITATQTAPPPGAATFTRTLTLNL